MSFICIRFLGYTFQLLGHHHLKILICLKWVCLSILIVSEHNTWNSICMICKHMYICWGSLNFSCKSFILIKKTNCDSWPQNWLLFAWCLILRNELCQDARILTLLVKNNNLAFSQHERQSVNWWCEIISQCSAWRITLKWVFVFVDTHCHSKCVKL